MDAFSSAGDEGSFSYTWSPGADTSALDEGEVAQPSPQQEPEQEEPNVVQQEEVEGTDGLGEDSADGVPDDDLVRGRNKVAGCLSACVRGYLFEGFAECPT